MVSSIGYLNIFTRWIILQCDSNIGKYYRNLYSLEYFYKPKIQKPLWDAHITIVRNECTINETFRNKYNQIAIKFEYETKIQTNGVHFWLPVYSVEIDQLRIELQLHKYTCPLHLSIGNIVNETGNTLPEKYYDLEYTINQS